MTICNEIEWTRESPKISKGHMMTWHASHVTELCGKKAPVQNSERLHFTPCDPTSTCDMICCAMLARPTIAIWYSGACPGLPRPAYLPRPVHCHCLGRSWRNFHELFSQQATASQWQKIKRMQSIHSIQYKHSE